YQTQADDIVGKMTMAALDREMFQKEHEPPGPNTCRLLHACPCDVPGFRGPSLGFAITAVSAGVGAPAPPTDAELIRKALEDSVKTRGFAILKLNGLADALMAKATTGGDLDPENQRVFAAVRKWLSLNTQADLNRAIKHTFRAMDLMIRSLVVKTSTGG